MGMHACTSACACAYVSAKYYITRYIDTKIMRCDVEPTLDGAS